MHSFALSALSLALPLVAQGASYTLKTSYAGSSFFDGFNFDTVDTNAGNAAYQTADIAAQQKLAYVDTASSNAIIKVDNTTVGNPQDQTFGRATVQIKSKDTISQGSLLLIDSLHMPYGCSVWPAIWLLGDNDHTQWPNHGEIDIYEGVNLQAANQYSLHTLQGCQHPATINAAAESGTLSQADCFNQTNGNEGCLVKETKPSSMGAAFANNGGGAYGLEWSTEGIKTWFFPRSAIPSDFTSDSPNPSSWGLPSAFYPESSCDTSKYFGPQTLVINIEVCGSFANATFADTCSSVAPVCVDVIKTPTTYDTAYFEFKSVRVFTDGTTSSSNSSSTSSTGTAKSSSTATGTKAASGTPTSAPSSATQISASWSFLTVVGVTSLSMIFGAIASFGTF